MVVVALDYRRRWAALSPVAALFAGVCAFGGATDAEAREVYINLDPTTLVDNNGQNPVTNSFTSSGFTAGPVSGMSLTPAQRDELLFWLKEATYPFDITFTFDRPANPGYDMVVFGTDTDHDARFADIAGCSTAIGLSDCVDAELENISFVFYGCLAADDQSDMRRIAFHALTALGFGWGLENLSVSGEIMGGFSVFGVEFGNSCQAVVDAQCDHEVCTTGQQNSTEDLLARLGARVDDGPPTLSITSPGDMEVVNPTFTVAADIADGFGGLDVNLELVEVMQSQGDPEPPYSWDLNNIPDGAWTVRVTVTDADGNEVSDEVTACVGSCTVQGGSTGGDSGNSTTDASTTSDSGGSTGASTGEETSGGTAPLDPSFTGGNAALGPAGGGCYCSSTDSEGSSGALGLLLGLLLVRRRRRSTPAE
jgi:MYXO-CTERM domain-containing protein